MLSHYMIQDNADCYYLRLNPKSIFLMWYQSRVNSYFWFIHCPYQLRDKVIDSLYGFEPSLFHLNVTHSLRDWTIVSLYVVGRSSPYELVFGLDQAKRLIFITSFQNETHPLFRFTKFWALVIYSGLQISIPRHVGKKWRVECSTKIKKMGCSWECLPHELTFRLSRIGGTFFLSKYHMQQSSHSLPLE